MATEEAERRDEADGDDDTPELLIKLRERKERHEHRHILYRLAIVILGFLIVDPAPPNVGPGPSKD